ncbi:MAG TPA: helix-turn-helix domain-containing protein [Acetobacteraceae bacterium]|jgi:DNA-binding MarR family transcriptional regulator
MTAALAIVGNVRRNTARANGPEETRRRAAAHGVTPLLNSCRMDDADRADGSPARVSDLAKDALYFRYHLVEFVTEHLIDLSQTFAGDLQQVLVLAIIGQVHVNQVLQSGNNHGKTTQSISASRIADITCIPRQTVRRKLETLEKRGWIEQDDQRSWHIVVREGRAAAQSDLAHLDARGILRGNRLAAAYKAKEDPGPLNASPNGESGEALERLREPYRAMNAAPVKTAERD